MHAKLQNELYKDREVLNSSSKISNTFSPANFVTCWENRSEGERREKLD